MSPRLIALLGAECTGKSTLGEALAAHYGAALVPEYLREWCDTHGRTPLRHEQAHIADEQSARIDAALRTHDLVICDTTPLITAVCSQHYFQDGSLLGAAVAFQRRCDMTLLCAPDLPWQADGFLRDGPEVRARIDALLRTALTAHKLSWTDIQGDDRTRLAQALRAID